MKPKSLIIYILIITGTVVALLFYLNKKNILLLVKAQQSEITGNKQEACLLYAEAVFHLIQAKMPPDIKRSKLISEEQFQKKIRKHLATFTIKRSEKNKNSIKAVKGLIRCTDTGNLPGPVSCSTPSITPFTTQTFFTEWKKIFFIAESHSNPSHSSLSKEMFLKNLSLITISSGHNYTYECMLLNTDTFSAIKCSILPQNSISLYALPGTYIFIARSTVTFPDNTVWKSDFTPFPITVPATSSHMRMNLQTSIQRRG